MTEHWTAEQAKEYLAQNARLVRKKAHKYGAKKTIVDGIEFPSAWEAQRYSILQLRARAGEIGELTLQPRYHLALSGPTEHAVLADKRGRPVFYVADFFYHEYLTNGLAEVMTGAGRAFHCIVEDAKGFATPVYRLKVKLFKAQYPDLIHRETKQKRRRRKRRK